MKSSVCQKLKSPFALWRELLTDPTDFIEMTIVGKTGNKTANGSVSLKDLTSCTYKAVLPGENINGSIATIFDWLFDRICLYDSCRMTLVMRGQSQILKVDNKGVSLQTGDNLQLKQKRSVVNHSYGASEKRDYKIQINQATDLLEAIGITDSHGKLKTGKWRKYYQIDRFVELAEPIIDELIKNEDSLNIYDLACGKSYLSFVLNYYIREKLNKTCRFTGIDISEQVVQSSRKLAEHLGYHNMVFKKMDLKEFHPINQVSLCISLHACDTATDMALAAAIKAKSHAIMAVPCCQRELLAGGFKMEPLQNSVMTSGILKARLADLMTDGIRLLLLRSAGYDADIIEYVSPLETPKNLMIKAVYSGQPDKLAWLNYQKLKKECQVDILLGREIENMKIHDV